MIVLKAFGGLGFVVFIGRMYASVFKGSDGFQKVPGCIRFFQDLDSVTFGVSVFYFSCFRFFRYWIDDSTKIKALKKAATPLRRTAQSKG